MSAAAPAVLGNESLLTCTLAFLQLSDIAPLACTSRTFYRVSLKPEVCWQQLDLSRHPDWPASVLCHIIDRAADRMRILVLDGSRGFDGSVTAALCRSPSLNELVMISVCGVPFLDEAKRFSNFLCRLAAALNRQTVAPSACKSIAAPLIVRVPVGPDRFTPTLGNYIYTTRILLSGICAQNLRSGAWTRPCSLALCSALCGAPAAQVVLDAHGVQGAHCGICGYIV